MFLAKSELEIHFNNLPYTPDRTMFIKEMQLTLQRDTNYLDPVLSEQFTQINIPLLHDKSDKVF